ncbi:MarR family winged helix-turn-helix transcriptional regulator [Streptomyces sp. NPDC094049]|uniref:MarR family winged helix-turn-helix transcriptional regulator n=1 Tax=Streptomyces sp. NPDC094049 TaxID=3154987 RepID=UPI003325F197
MDQPVVTGFPHHLPGATFAVVGIASAPTDWAKVFRSLAEAGLSLDPATGAGTATVPGSPGAPVPPLESAHGPSREPTRAAAQDPSRDPSPTPAPDPPPTAPRAPRSSPARAMSPPSVLGLNAYLMHAVGRSARRRLAETLEARGLRLWHLTVMTLLADLGPQMKTALATRLAINASDLVKVVDDLARAGQVDCVRDHVDRRRVVVRLTPEGTAALRELSAEIAAVDDEVLTPLDAGEREQLAALLRRVHAHLEPPPAGGRPAARGAPPG